MINSQLPITRGHDCRSIGKFLSCIGHDAFIVNLMHFLFVTFFLSYKLKIVVFDVAIDERERSACICHMFLRCGVA